MTTDPNVAPSHPAPDFLVGGGGSRSPLISVDDVALALRSGTQVVIWDVRWSLDGDGYRAYVDGHIPGARFVDLDKHLAGPAGPEGRHPLPDPSVFAELCARTGIKPDRPVIVTGQRDTSIAARAWWLLRWAGYDDVRVLDGGVDAWRRAGQAMDSGPDQESDVDGGPAPRPALTIGSMPTVGADTAAAWGAAADSVLLDARAAERYRGEVEPVDPVPGHIPGAVNLPVAAVHQADGRLLPAAELRRIFASVGVRESVPAAASCGSGVTACSLVLAAELAGLPVALYPGSYSGWCALGRLVERC